MTLLFTIISLFTLCATFRLLINNLNEQIENKYVNLISHPGWCSILIVYLPWKMGAFARGEDSPLPWVAFEQEFIRHGFWDGLLSLIIVITVLLWLFWMPSHLYIKSKPDIGKEAKILARIVNILLGLILVSENNFIYQLI